MAQAVSPSGSGTYYYVIEVKDKETKAPINRVNLSWGNGLVQSNQTSTNGRYTLIMKNTLNPEFLPVENEMDTSTEVAFRDMDDIPETLSCAVTATGYYSLNLLVSRSDGTRDVYTTFLLEKIQDNFYYNIIVKDSKTGNPISGADVEIRETINGPIINSKVTDNNGKCTYINQTGGELFFTAKKNGYSNSGSMGFFPGTTMNATYRTINITPTVSATYRYMIKVVNANGNPVSGVTVRLFNDFSMSSPARIQGLGSYSADDPKVEPEVFEDVKEVIADVLNIDKSRIKRTDMFGRDLGADSLDQVDIARVIEQKFRILIPTNQLIETVGQLVDFVRNETATGYYITIFTSNENGVISPVPDGFSSTSVPATLFAKGLSLPSGYTWSGSDNGQVPPITDPRYPSLTLRVSSAIQEDTIYNYDLEIVDGITNMPVEGVKVTFLDETEQLTVLHTNSLGKISYTSLLPSLSVSLIKDGFADNGYISVNGHSTNMTETISLVPLNTIRVMYDGNCGDLAGQPASDIVVSIGSYDDNKQYVERGKFKTYSNGYIDTLSTLFFTSSKYYATVINYVIDAEASMSALKKLLVSGETLILLPPRRQDSSTDDQIDFIEFNSLSANGIKKLVNKGNLELKNNLTSEKVTYSGGDDYRVNVQDPDSITTYDIFASTPVMINDSQKSVIASVDIGLKSDVNNLKLKVINRYSGYYNPIFKDILFYNNFTYDEQNPEKSTLLYSNTSFDYKYEDKYGKFGIINNMWFHKVNDNKDIEIINTLTPYYPLTGQYAVDFRDYNIFESNWDMNHYTRQLDVLHSESCQNISSMKNANCMFGSKYLNVPESIEIFGLTMGDDPEWNGEWNDDWITNPEGCPGEMMYKEVNNNSVDFYFFFKKRILRFFYDKLKDEFEQYMDPVSFSFGTSGVEDDIKEYVTKNVLKLYRLEKVRMFVRRTKKGQHNSKIENDYTSFLEYDKTHPETETFDFEKNNLSEYFIQHGFNEVNNITMTKMNRDDFDRKLVYNLRSGSKEVFGFSLVLKKI